MLRSIIASNGSLAFGHANEVHYHGTPPKSGPRGSLWKSLLGIAYALLMPLMTWLVPASFTAGVQADPGPAIWKLVVFLVVGLGLMVPLGVILTILSLELTDIDAGSSALGFYAAFALTLIGGPIGFLAGFTVPWLTGSPGPARWFANLVGLL